MVKFNYKKFLINVLIVYSVCFILLFLFLLHQDYEYYSVYDREELMEFFSMKDTILFDFRQTLSFSIRQMIIYVPVLAVFEKIKMKRWLKIILTLIITGILSFFFILFSL